MAKANLSEATNYRLKKRYSLVDGNDINGVVSAVNDAGFYVEVAQGQRPAKGKRSVTLSFPDGPEIVVEDESSADDLAYQLVRKLIEENVLS